MSDSSPSAAQEGLVKVALLGTERGGGLPPVPAGPLADMAAALAASADAEHSLLGLAAALSLYRRAGHRPATDSDPLPTPCPADPQPIVGPRAAAHLDQILSGKQRDLLAEWLGELAALGRRVPHTYLVALLDLGRNRPALQASILPVLGERGRWLAAQNSDWNYAAPAPRDPSAAWETGNPTERLAALRMVRAADPARAREMLGEVWAGEPADRRVQFLATLEAGLSLADEPFLESVLDDRSKEARRGAADLLSHLPNSALAARMRARVEPLLALERGRLMSKPKIKVTLPQSCDKVTTRDGIDPKPPSGMGEKAWWLAQMLSMVPPTLWSAGWGITPDEILSLTRKTEWDEALLHGFAQATVRYGDAAWAAALLAGGKSPTPAVDGPDLMRILPPARRDAFLVRLLAADNKALYGNSTAMQLIWECPAPWSNELSRAVLSAVRRRIIENTKEYDWYLRQGLSRFGQYIPPALLAEATTGWPTTAPKWQWWSEVVQEFTDTLHFRAEMISALRQE